MVKTSEMSMELKQELAFTKRRTRRTGSGKENANHV